VIIFLVDILGTFLGKWEDGVPAVNGIGLFDG
jgi:hypothetical protein